MPDRSFALGIDFGTASVRALIVDTASGEEIATGVCDYPTGEQGVILDARDPNLARQHPGDYVEGLQRCVADALRQAAGVAGFRPERIVGIGVDTTGSTPLPVDRDGTPLGLRPEFRDEPAAQAWLWKDHTAHAEAAEITAAIAGKGLPYLSKCGGVYSSEWYWSKILHCERAHPRVAQAAAAWVELCDYIPALLTGKTDPAAMARSICAAGHKAMYHADWGGLPAASLLEALQPGLSRFRYDTTPVASNHAAGALARGPAERLGLPAGIPVAVGALDAHHGAVGSGCAPGTLVKIMGTSTCDCCVADLARPLPDIPGVCGIVPESILPGMYGIEAGQSAVGDLFDWFVRRIAPSDFGPPAERHARLTEAAARLRPGESGLLALDWHNGNRTVLVDPLLTGLMVGETLATTPAEVYRALIEATAFGARMILDRLEQYGVTVERIVACGGIPDKSPLVMQIYADVCERPLHVARSGQTSALGAAIFGAVAGGAHRTAADAQRAMAGVRPTSFRPDSSATPVYRRLYALYRSLHDAFGVRGSAGALHEVMKELIAIRQEARTSAGC